MTRQRAEALLVLDLEVARLLDTLRATGELEDTVLMFTSDNGYFLGEHRKRPGKKLPYEPSLRVPLVVAGPGVPHGKRYDPVKTPDLTATIVDLAGAGPRTPRTASRCVRTIRQRRPGLDRPGRHRGHRGPRPPGRHAGRRRPRVRRTPAPPSGCAPRATSSSAGPPAPSSSTTSSATPTS